MKSNENEIGQIGKGTGYEEKAPFSNSMRDLMVYFLLLLVLSLYIASYFEGHFVPFEGQYILLLTTMVLSLAVWNFFKLKFRITEKNVEAVMPIFSHRVPFSEIKEITTIDDISCNVGWGIRIWGRRLAFVSMHKKAVKIEKENGYFRALFLTTRDPDVFVRMVKESMEGNAKCGVTR